jgi:hypothetical protein
MCGTKYQFLAFSPRLAGLRLPLGLQSLDQGRCVLECGLEVVLEAFPVGEVEATRVYFLAEIYQIDPVPDGAGAGYLVAQRLATLVGLHHDVNPLDAVEVAGPLHLPGISSRDAKGRDAVIPERLCVALALHEHDPPRLPYLLQVPQAVEHGLAARAPPEALVALLGLLQRNPEADRAL